MPRGIWTYGSFNHSTSSQINQFRLRKLRKSFGLNIRIIFPDFKSSVDCCHAGVLPFSPHWVNSSKLTQWSYSLLNLTSTKWSGLWSFCKQIFRFFHGYQIGEKKRQLNAFLIWYLYLGVVRGGNCASAVSGRLNLGLPRYCISYL